GKQAAHTSRFQSSLGKQANSNNPLRTLARQRKRACLSRRLTGSDSISGGRSSVAGGVSSAATCPPGCPLPGNFFIVHHAWLLRWVSAPALISKERLKPLIGQLPPCLLRLRARAERSHLDAEQFVAGAGLGRREQKRRIATALQNADQRCGVLPGARGDDLDGQTILHAGLPAGPVLRRRAATFCAGRGRASASRRRCLPPGGRRGNDLL